MTELVPGKAIRAALTCLKNYRGCSHSPLFLSICIYLSQRLLTCTLKIALHEREQKESIVGNSGFFIALFFQVVTFYLVERMFVFGTIPILQLLL
jgi:hypothetical protein